MWTVWDKESNIDGHPAEYYLNTFPHLVAEKTIFLGSVNGKVVRIESKRILAKVHGIDPALPDDEFIAEYERILATPPEEIPEGIPEEEETDTTTYAELAQVYAEGVNSIE